MQFDSFPRLQQLRSNPYVNRLPWNQAFLRFYTHLIRLFVMLYESSFVKIENHIDIESCPCQCGFSSSYSYRLNFKAKGTIVLPHQSKKDTLEIPFQYQWQLFQAYHMGEFL